MKYKNATTILPQDFIEELQQYVQGEYIYIPIKDTTRNATPTDYDIELEKRDEHIYEKALEGVSNKKLSIIYNLSESSIRRIINNQRKRCETLNYQVQEIIRTWDVDDLPIKQIYNTTWQIGEAYVLKVYDDVTMLERNIKIITILDQMGIPVGSILPTKKDTTYAKDNQHFYMLTKKLPGNNIVELHKNNNIGIEMGTILADLHLALKECETQDEFWNNSLLEELKGWIRNAFIKDNWQGISEAELNAVVDKLESLYDKLPVQLIHRDVYFGNFLFHEGEFSGYIDFDLSQRNIRIFDLCYFMLGLLSEELKLGITKELWFATLHDLVNGYEKKCKLQTEEKESIPYVMEAIELLFIAWFREQKDVKCAKDAMKIYEFIKNNETNIKQ